MINDSSVSSASRLPYCMLYRRCWRLRQAFDRRICSDAFPPALGRPFRTELSLPWQAVLTRCRPADCYLGLFTFASQRVESGQGAVDAMAQVRDEKNRLAAWRRAC